MFWNGGYDKGCGQPGAFVMVAPMDSVAIETSMKYSMGAPKNVKSHPGQALSYHGNDTIVAVQNFSR